MIILSLFILSFFLVLALGFLGFIRRLFFGRDLRGSRPGSSSGSHPDARPRKKEGEVSIDYVPPRQDAKNAEEAAMKRATAAAEDIDFEEIK